MAGDRAESKSFNTVANLALRTEEKGYHILVMGLTQQRMYSPYYVFLSNFAHIVHNYLNETFPGRWIGRGSPRFWATRSRDLTPLDFFEWGHIKTQVNKVKIRDL